MLCVRRTLDRGRRAGFVSGLGAASADAVYGAIAGFGVTALSALLLDHRTAIRVGGGLLLLYLGAQSVRADPTSTRLATATTSADGRARGLVRDYGSTFLLTLTNPVTVLAFVAIFAGTGVATSGDARDVAALVGGVFTGSALWWLALSTLVSRFRTRLGPTSMQWVNRSAGAVLVGFGLLALWSALPG